MVLYIHSIKEKNKMGILEFWNLMLDKPVLFVVSKMGKEKFVTIIKI
jgi:hypothetical protein